MEQILHANPMNEERKPTNTFFIIVLGLIFLTWLGNGIKAITDTSPVVVELFKEADEITETKVVQRENNLPGLNLGILDELTLKFTWSYVVCTIIGGLIAIFYVYFLSLSKSKFVTEGAVYLLCVWMVLILVLNSILSAFFVDNMLIHFGFIFTLTYAAYIVISFRCARNVGTKEIFEIIKDSCRALSGCLAIPLFLCVVSSIIALIAYTTVYVAYCILSLDPSNKSLTTLIYSSINVFSGLTLIYFFANFIRLVISGYVIDCYWMRDQHLSPMTFIKHSITRVSRYHLGTLAFSSIPLLSYICAVFQVCRPRKDDNKITKIYNVITRFCSQWCTFFHIADFALVQTSVYGHDYMTAITAAHDLVAQNNHELNIAVTEVSLIVARIGYFFIGIPFAYDRIQSASYSVIFPFAIVFTTAVQALLVNKMIIEKASETLQKDRDCALNEIPTAESPEPEPQPCVY